MQWLKNSSSFLNLNSLSRFLAFSTMSEFKSPPGAVAPSLKTPEGSQVATVAAGCFWGVEHMYRKHFGNGKGLIDARVGYTGGNQSNPDYKQVCTSSTGHAEALQVSFDPKLVGYDTLIDFFFRMHDPTTLNSQGPDVGTQYRSGVFYHDDKQKSIAEDVKNKMQKEFYKTEIVTEIVPIDLFWDAEQYHQLYLDNNPEGYACPSHFLREKPAKEKSEL